MAAVTHAATLDSTPLGPTSFPSPSFALQTIFQVCTGTKPITVCHDLEGAAKFCEIKLYRRLLDQR